MDITPDVKEKSIKLSIIIPCFNEAEYISTQLEALIGQRWDDVWEVVIADNGSTDATLVIVEQYRDKLPHLKIIDASARRGASFARNMGVKASEGDFLAFCDADDEVAPGWIAEIASAIAKYGFVASRMDAEKLSDPEALKAKGNKRQQEGLMVYRYGYVDYLPHAGACGLGIKRIIHDQIGGFDEEILYCEDADYCWRVHLSGTPLCFVPEALINIRHKSGSVNRYWQAVNWGEYNVLLNKKFRPLGMPKVSWKFCARCWLNLLKDLPEIVNKNQREKWLWNFANRIGHLKGSLKYRIFAL